MMSEPLKVAAIIVDETLHAAHHPAQQTPCHAADRVPASTVNPRAGPLNTWLRARSAAWHRECGERRARAVDQGEHLSGHVGGPS
jgi:hypothetical protein